MTLNSFITRNSSRHVSNISDLNVMLIVTTFKSFEEAAKYIQDWIKV